MNYEQMVENIQRAGLETCMENVVPKELTYQQALSIHLRSLQLKQEGEAYYKNVQKRKKKEIDICWRKPTSK